MTAEITTVLNFWFKELTPKQWFVKDEQLDETIKERFVALHRQAAANELYEWRTTAQGALAEIIILDQFSRNIFRNSAQAFGYDSLALALAQNAVQKELDKQLKPEESAFIYMPYMHSESLLVHQQALVLFDKPELTHNLTFEEQHLAIIERFGRYPHRNEMLGRTSTPEELAFLQEPNSSF